MLSIFPHSAASVGVIIAAIVTSLTGCNEIDPLISVLIGVVILYGSGKIVLESSHILLEGVPRGIVFNDVVDDIGAIKGVTGVHNLNIWSICCNINTLIAHVGVDECHLDKPPQLLKNINEMLAEKHQISYTTIQIECTRLDDCGGLLCEVKHHERRKEDKCG